MDSDSNGTRRSDKNHRAIASSRRGASLSKRIDFEYIELMGEQDLLD